MFLNKQNYKQLEKKSCSFLFLLLPGSRLCVPLCDDVMAGKSKMLPYRHLYSLMKTDLAITDI